MDKNGQRCINLTTLENLKGEERSDYLKLFNKDYIKTICSIFDNQIINIQKDMQNDMSKYIDMLTDLIKKKDLLIIDH